MIHKLEIPLFNQPRTIRVYLPRDYAQSENRYPVLYMHDGQNVFGEEEAIGGVSLNLHHYLDENHKNLIVVAIDLNSAGKERVNEYCPWKNGEFSRKLLDGVLEPTGGKGKEYVKWMVQELKPLIDDTYRTVSNKSYIAGISLGGLISLYAAATYPTIFSRVAAFSSGFYRNQEEMEAYLKVSPLETIDRLYMDCGTTEVDTNEEISKLFLQSTQSIYDLVKERIKSVEFHVLDGEIHHYEAFKKRVPAMIQFIVD